MKINYDSGTISESSASSMPDLIDVITTWPVGMPVRAMEKLLGAGETAIPFIAERLSRWRDDRSRDLLWLIVVLGELRHAAAVKPLLNQLRQGDLDVLALAAAEALAKIGSPAVPVLVDATTAPDPYFRLYAYATLGWIEDEKAFAGLITGLARDYELGHVLANALADQGRSEAIPHLYNAYRVCNPQHRPDFEDAIRDLHWGTLSRPRWVDDWRLRYRRIPGLGTFEPAWPGISAFIRRVENRLPSRPKIPVRPLDEIVKERPEAEELSESCETCGAVLEFPTGLPVCPETALTMVLYQLKLLNEAREKGWEDIFDVLDNLEDRQWDLLNQGEPKSKTTRQEWQRKLEDLGVFRQTCKWLVEQNVEDVAAAKALLLAKAVSVVERYGDPTGLFEPARAPVRAGPKTGRNDPCPCGSGKKYKKCCMGRT